MKNSQNGNALWFILIAIFLLGGLTVLLSRTSGTTEDTGGLEQASIKASEILKYAGAISSAVQNLSLKGCSENNISFYSTKWGTPANYDNTNSPVASGVFNCHVFNVKGGGVDYKAIPSGASSNTEYLITGRTAIQDVGTTSPELLLIVPNIDATICKAINRSLNAQSFAKDSYKEANYFIGSFGAALVTVGDGGTNPTYVEGKKSLCLQTPDDGGGLPQAEDSYYFYHVLIAR